MIKNFEIKKIKNKFWCKNKKNKKNTNKISSFSFSRFLGNSLYDNQVWIWSFSLIRSYIERISVIWYIYFGNWNKEYYKIFVIKYNLCYIVKVLVLVKILHWRLFAAFMSFLRVKIKKNRNNKKRANKNYNIFKLILLAPIISLGSGRHY